ncbi:MAG: hypothetical protein WBC91_18675 [Phototrophicaceae bacterium]
MMAAKFEVTNLLYAENIHFLRGFKSKPENYDEILNTLRIRYGVRDINMLQRLLFIPLTLFASFALSYLGTLIVVNLITTLEESINYLILLMSVIFILVSIYMSAYLLRLSVHLILHRKKSVNKSLEDLLKKPQILEGRIIQDKNISIESRLLKYRVINPIGKTIVGKYYLENVKRNIPETIIVLFADNTNHTLL